MTTGDELPRVLVIGGLDPSGGAGISADARTLLAHGCEALPVLSAFAVQNRFGMQRVEDVASDLVLAQLRAALDDGGVRVVKTGLLGSASRVREVAAWLGELAAGRPLVVDPVLSSTSGGHAAGPEVALAYRQALAPLASVLTPNEPELAAIAGPDGAHGLLRDGCRAVLHKGGHGDGAVAVDRWVTETSTRPFAHPRLALGPVHGTGCALASAIAAGLARGLAADVAVARAIDWLQDCLRALAPTREAGLRGLPIVVARQ